MRKVMIIVLLAICTVTYGQSQDSIKYNGTLTPIPKEGNIVTGGDPLFMISLNNQVIEINQSEIFKDSLGIDPSWILTVNVYKGQDALDRYGERAKNGAILIDLKKGSADKLPPDLKRRFTAYKN